MLLLTPGPVKLAENIRMAQSREMITHRGKDFQNLYGPMIRDIKEMVKAEEVHIMTGSGTLGIEANVQNSLPEGGKALCLSNGAFGDRLLQHCQLYYETTFARLNDAKGWNLERAKKHIDEACENGVKLLAMVHHETSPGILNKCGEICKYAKEKGMLTLLDGTSAYPAHEFGQEGFYCDFYSWGSQKAIGAPPGLVVVSHSKEAVDAIEKSPVRSNFMNLKAYRKMLAKKPETPNTPAISIMYAFSVALEMLKKETPKGAAKRHAKQAKHIRERIREMGFKLVVEEGFQSNGITAFYTEKNKELNKLLQEKYNVKLGGGHSDWKDNSLRFCNLGHVTDEEIEKGLDSLMKAKEELGI